MHRIMLDWNIPGHSEQGQSVQEESVRSSPHVGEYPGMFNLV
jgi:hypothetical protein